MALFRRRKFAMEQEVLELQSAVIALCETADADRAEHAAIRTRMGQIERMATQQQHSIIAANESITARLSSLSGLRMSTPLPPPPPQLAEVGRAANLGTTAPVRPHPPMPSHPIQLGANGDEGDIPGSLTYLRGLAESAVRASASQAAAMDSLKARQNLLDERIDVLDNSIVERVIAGQSAALSGIDGHIDARIEAIRQAQIRLANEQARHEIATRAELAEVIDRFRFADSDD